MVLHDGYCICQVLFVGCLHIFQYFLLIFQSEFIHLNVQLINQAHHNLIITNTSQYQIKIYRMTQPCLSLLIQCLFMKGFDINSQKMSKSGVCSCGQTVTIPKSQCLFQCHRCSNVGVFLCHMLGQPKDPMHIRCKQCKLMYSMYNCPQCEAFAVIKGFQSGKMYNCLCGFQATMISCGKCTSLLCLPTRSNYENTLIKCKKCDHEFKYRLCPACGECNYLKPSQSPLDGPLCFNQLCQLFQKQPIKEPVKPQFPMQIRKNPAIQVEANPYEQLLPSNPQKKESQLCNICLNRQKCMINTVCYHLSVCQPCSLDLQGRCPICRKEGTYQKVYRS